MVRVIKRTQSENTSIWYKVHPNLFYTVQFYTESMNYISTGKKTSSKELKGSRGFINGNTDIVLHRTGKGSLLDKLKSFKQNKTKRTNGNKLHLSLLLKGYLYLF